MRPITARALTAFLALGGATGAIALPRAFVQATPSSPISIAAPATHPTPVIHVQPALPLVAATRPARRPPVAPPPRPATASVPVARFVEPQSVSRPLPPAPVVQVTQALNRRSLPAAAEAPAAPEPTPPPPSRPTAPAPTPRPDPAPAPAPAPEPEPTPDPAPVTIAAEPEPAPRTYETTPPPVHDDEHQEQEAPSPEPDPHHPPHQPPHEQQPPAAEHVQQPEQPPAEHDHVEEPTDPHTGIHEHARRALRTQDQS